MIKQLPDGRFYDQSTENYFDKNHFNKFPSHYMHRMIKEGRVPKMPFPTTVPAVSATKMTTAPETDALRRRLIKATAEVAAMREEKMRLQVAAQIARHNKIYKVGVRK